MELDQEIDEWTSPLLLGPSRRTQAQHIRLEEGQCYCKARRLHFRSQGKKVFQAALKEGGIRNSQFIIVIANFAHVYCREWV